MTDNSDAQWYISIKVHITEIVINNNNNNNNGNNELSYYTSFFHIRIIRVYYVIGFSLQQMTENTLLYI